MRQMMGTGLQVTAEHTLKTAPSMLLHTRSRSWRWGTPATTSRRRRDQELRLQAALPILRYDVFLQHQKTSNSLLEPSRIVMDLVTYPDRLNTCSNVVHYALHVDSAAEKQGMYHQLPVIESCYSYLLSCAADTLVQLDANFSQKRRKSDPDPPLSHPNSHFLSEAEVQEMEQIVADARRPSKKGKQKATVSKPLVVPDTVLDDCGKSFIAAQETVAKASTGFYSDTGLMALLCRHDRVLWLVNLTSTGEKQHYALALLRRLFSELPGDWTVGLLYDIACQIHRSIVKVCLSDLSGLMPLICLPLV